MAAEEGGGEPHNNMGNHLQLVPGNGSGRLGARRESEGLRAEPGRRRWAALGWA